MKIKILVIALLFGCFSCSKVPFTNRKQVNLLPESELIAMSLTSYNEFLSQNPPINLPDANAAMVKTVGSRISIAVTNYMKKNGYAKRVDGYKWDFKLVNSKEVNAWCMPGGKIVVYTGLLPITKDEAGLAFVMGHEVAHAIARHGNERMSQLLLAQTGGVALDVALSSQSAQTHDIFMEAYGVGAQLGVILPFSRSHESEADKLGMIFMAMAGYDPAQAPLVWQRMINSNSGPKPPEFLSTHPADDKRISAIRSYLPTAAKFYKKPN